MPDRPPQEPNTGVITLTESTPIPEGMDLRVETWNLEFPPVKPTVTDVGNWDCFDGALLAVAIQYGDSYVVDGTAVMIGLGLALTAKHVLDTHRVALQKGEAVAFCFGMRPNAGIDIWKCCAMTVEDGVGDLELLSLVLLSDWPADGSFKVLSLTTRIPPAGETLTVAGFRIGEPGIANSTDGLEPIGGLLNISRGAAGDFDDPDRYQLAYPTIEIQCSTVGGMSGGAAFDANNHVVGIISKGGFDNDEGGFTWAAWWMSTYFWRPAPRQWPAGVADENVSVWQLDSVSIVGREYVRVLEEPKFALTRWT